MRRTDIYKLGPSTPKDKKASNARLFFMYNPASIQRTYLQATATADAINPTGDPSGPDQAGVPYLNMTSVTFELLFDRQEEVNRYPNHPGCLIDLAIFDLLSRGGSPGQTTTDDMAVQDAKFDATADTSGGGAVSVSTTGTNQTIDSSNMVLDMTIQIAAIFSPNIVFYGTIMAADAYFEKFSHRMTPIRMRLVLTMRLRGVGAEQAATVHDATVEAAAANQAALSALTPLQDVATDAKRDEINAAGRASAMKWAENWLPGHATAQGVIYDLNKRCSPPGGNVQDDNYLVTTPPHVPTGLDCSAYVARSYGVIGWLDALHLPQCADTDHFEQAATHDDVWDVLDFKTMGGFIGNLSDSSKYDAFNKWVKPGDLVLRSGSGKAGHIGFIHDDVGGGDGGDHQWKILHSYQPGLPPQITDPYKTSYIIANYSKVLRPHAVKTGQNQPAVMVVPGSVTTP
jgi:hypothetical protein